MIKSILITIALFFSVKSFSQTDTTHKDSIKTYAIILNEQEYNSLIALIKEAAYDSEHEKPSVINKAIEFLASRTQLILPNKAQPKK